MSKRPQPKLHLVRGGTDAELYCSDLDWFYSVYDSECGLKSIGIANILDAATMLGSYTSVDNNAIPCKVSITRDLQKWFEGGPWDDHHAQFKGRGDFCAFTRGRRVWNRLRMLPWEIQELLRRYYEARQLRDRDEAYWHDLDDPEKFDTTGRMVAASERKQLKEFKSGRVEFNEPHSDVIRAAHRQYYLKQEAA